MENKLFLKFH